VIPRYSSPSTRCAQPSRPLTITAVEAKDKLSQNRGALDQGGVVAGLRGQHGPGPDAIAELMAASLEAAGEVAP
jgi:predicted FMN-binding regulatory protein PaiB